MLIAALFTLAKVWTQPKGSSIDEWKRCGTQIYTMTYLPAIKKDEILPLCESMDGPRSYYS